MMTPKKIALILSGCGVFDGSEIQETVLCLLSLAQKNAQVRCFAPDNLQDSVINHLTGEVSNESRHVLIESARITRGHIQPLAALNPEEFDGLILPGGFGVAKNLSNFATQGANLQIDATLLSKAQAFIQTNKALGLICIAPVLAGILYSTRVRCTVGNTSEVSDTLEKIGAQHVTCTAGDIIVDHKNKLVSTPGYMIDSSIAEVASGISKLVDAVLELA